METTAGFPGLGSRRFKGKLVIHPSVLWPALALLYPMLFLAWRPCDDFWKAYLPAAAATPHGPQGCEPEQR